MAITGLGRRGVFDYVLTMFEGKKADHRLLRRSGAVARIMVEGKAHVGEAGECGVPMIVVYP